MKTTPANFLEELSVVLNETTTDTSARRVKIFNRAARFTINKYKFDFRIKEAGLTFVAEDQEYDMTAEVSDYDTSSGIFEVWNGTEEIYPIAYGNRANYTNAQRFYITPDGKSIGFTKTLDGTETYKVYYYATFTNASSDTDTLNISIPEDFVTPIVTYMKHLVHESKRQRYDARNAILDYQEQMQTVILQYASGKARRMPKTVRGVWDYTSFRRDYDR